MHMRKVTVSRMREIYAQTVLTFRITYVQRDLVVFLIFIVDVASFKICNHNGCDYKGRYIMFSGITKIYYRTTVGHVFTKPL